MLDPASPQPTSWHHVDVDETLSQLQSDSDQGLSDAAVHQRQQQFGLNELTDRGGVSPWRILWGQITSIMVVILILAGLIAAFLGDLEDTLVIFALVIINTLIGFNQEYRAERSMAALKQMAVPLVRVRREGRVQDLPAPQLVPGDIVLLEAGNRVPADGRVLHSASLHVQEAALTGESVPVAKIATTLAAGEIALGDRRNMLYLGTEVTRGRAEMVVTATGMRTELGKIADLIQTVQDDPTPLQRRLEQLGKQLATLALVIVALVFVLGLLRGDPLDLLLLTAISLAVAAVPEGLPATVTIALSLGAQRMLARNALIRKLPAVETLGSVTTICSDKTGTLTENRMTVTVLDIAGAQFELAGAAALPIPQLEERPGLELLLAGAALANDAQPSVPLAEDPADILGDPTEVALIVASNRQGMHKTHLDHLLPRVAEAPFDSERKRMTTLHRLPPGQPRRGNLGEGSARREPPVPDAPTPQIADFLADLAAILQIGRGSAAGLQIGRGSAAGSPAPIIGFTKGAVDGLLEVADRAWLRDREVPLDDELRERILTANARMAANGLRVLGVAYRAWEEIPAEDGPAALERNLVIVGMIGMIDPARPEVRAAVQTCREAGIHVKMITGDHPATAAAIARELGILFQFGRGSAGAPWARPEVGRTHPPALPGLGREGRGGSLLGVDLDGMDDAALRDALEDVAVFARVAPEHKLRIVQALQAQGEIVAMTGDGVNDAPALKQADIGVAMGITGTDVTKEAAKMVLRDDNFATIVAAVAEGRVVYANIRKFIRYLLTGNVAEIAVMLLSPFLGMPLALLPLQILWINLLTDGLPALALGVEPAERDVMRQPPRSPGDSILGRGMGQQIAVNGLVLALLALGVGYWAWRAGNPHWQTMVFTTLTFGQMAAVLTLRADGESFFRLGIRRNPLLIAAVTLTVILQLAVTYLPFLQGLFGTMPLTATDAAICIGVGVGMLLWIELMRLVWPRR